MIPVVFSSDHNFIMPTGVAILSMLESSQNVDFDIFILQSESVTDRDRKYLRNIVADFKARISFISVGSEFDNSYEVRGISTASYYRLLIPWLIPDYDWIIYLDGDIIVKSDISHMLSYAKDASNYIYGVRTPGFTTDPDVITYIRSLGLSNRGYINGGIQVFNAKLMREDDVKQRFLAFQDKKLLYQDQDIINLVCKGRIGWLPLTFNSSPSLVSVDSSKLIKSGVTSEADYAEAVAAPVVIHYAGKKPWKTFTYHWYDWWSVYSRSPFFDPQFAHDSASKVLNPDYSIKQLAKLLIKKLLKLK